MASSTRTVTLPFNSAQIRPYVKQYVQFWVPQIKKDTELLEKNPLQDHRGGQGTGEWLRDQRLFSLEKRKLRGNLVNAQKYLKGRCEENDARLFSMVPSDRTGYKGHKMEHRKFRTNIRKNFSGLTVTDHWNKLLRQFIVFPSLEILKSCLYTFLGNLL